MKQLILSAIVLLAGLAVNAQVKIGHINSAELITIMPEARKADSAIEAYQKTFEAQYQKIGKEIETKLAKYQNKATPDAERALLEQDLQGLQEKAAKYENTAKESINKKREELLKPIMEKADKALKDVAKEKGYTYVIDSSTGALLVAPDADNLLPLVKVKLGIK